MFGVVLWSDEQEQKAVIWCEDHGDLAFYRNTDGTTRFTLDAGDWVQFDMTMERRQRFAHNPILVHEGVYPDLADALCAAPVPAPQRSGRVMQAGPGRSERAQRSGGRESAQIISFASAQTARQREAVGQVQANRA